MGKRGKDNRAGKKGFKQLPIMDMLASDTPESKGCVSFTAGTGM